MAVVNQHGSISGFGKMQQAVKDNGKIKITDIRDCLQQFLIFFIVNQPIGNVAADHRIIGKKVCMNRFLTAVLLIRTLNIAADRIQIREKILLFKIVV